MVVAAVATIIVVLFAGVGAPVAVLVAGRAGSGRGGRLLVVLVAVVVVLLVAAALVVDLLVAVPVGMLVVAELAAVVAA